MLQVIESSAAVNRLVGLLKSRYGLDMRIRSIQAVNSDNLLEQGMQVLRGDLHIPISSNEHFFATAQVVGGEKLSQRDRKNINDLVQAVLEPEFYNWYLQQMTDNAIHAQETENVRSIFDQKINKRHTQSTNAIYLYANDTKRLLQVSHELHNLSDRWAYLQYRELSEQLRDAEDIKSLGSLTLQMGNVEQLSTKDQEKILSYLKISSYEDHPLMIILGNESLSSLVDKKLILPALAAELSRNSLNVDRISFDLDLLQETLEFML